MVQPGEIVSANHSRGLHFRIALAGVILSILTADIAVFSGLGHRTGIWGFRTGLTVFRYSGYLGLFSLLICLAAVFLSLRKGVSGRRGGSIALASFGFVISSAVIAVLFYWYVMATGLPRIHDITTDTADPPRFSEVLKHRTEALNSPEYGGRETAELQKKAYPDIQTLRLPVGPDKAFSAAFAAAKESGWQIHYSDPKKGWIEATDETFWFGFKDDIAVRIKADKGGTGGVVGSAIDVRSASRVGISDVGKNAARIRVYLERVRKNYAKVGGLK